ncbi:Hypothetical protein POVN_LOCUS539 [uncultured virus]|nr:Hypothetical protein POVN_LOCUS539 [uncultured virus]
MDRAEAMLIVARLYVPNYMCTLLNFSVGSDPAVQTPEAILTFYDRLPGQIGVAAHHALEQQKAFRQPSLLRELWQWATSQYYQWRHSDEL